MICSPNTDAPGEGTTDEDAEEAGPGAPVPVAVGLETEGAADPGDDVDTLALSLGAGLPGLVGLSLGRLALSLGRLALSLGRLGPSVGTLGLSLAVGGGTSTIRTTFCLPVPEPKSYTNLYCPGGAVPVTSSHRFP
jgi:hypothetical protein